MNEIAAACRALGAGAIVGIPTDTVYGLGVDPLRRDAIGALYALKQREMEKAIPILVADAAQAAEIVDVSAVAAALMERHWPGGLTIVCRRRRDVPVHIGDPVTATVAVRAPDHAVASALLRRCGPLAVTSANVSGQPSVLVAAQAEALFGDRVALYLEGDEPGGMASTVVDATTDDLLVLRPGSVEVDGS